MKSVTVNVSIQFDLTDTNLDTVLDAIGNINQGLARDGEFFYNAQILANGIDVSDIVDADEDLGSDEVEYRGINYSRREVLINGEVETISTETLSEALMNPENDLPWDDEAEAIDNEIFFYVADADLILPHDELVALIEKSL